MDDIIIDEILTSNDNVTPGKQIDWDCLDFGGDTRTETEKFIEKFPKFDDAFYVFDALQPVFPALET